jgi:hypothetical protein
MPSARLTEESGSAHRAAQSNPDVPEIVGLVEVRCNVLRVRPGLADRQCARVEAVLSEVRDERRSERPRGIPREDVELDPPDPDPLGECAPSGVRRLERRDERIHELGTARHAVVDEREDVGEPTGIANRAREGDGSLPERETLADLIEDAH